MPRLMTLIALSSVMGCGVTDQIGSHGDAVAVVDDYDKDFAWSDPAACSVFLHQRVTDQSARIVEYLARIGDDELSVLYSMDEAAPLPLRIDVVRADRGAALAIAFSDQRLEISDGQGDLVAAVDDYAAGAAGAVVTPGTARISDELLGLLRCVLPVRGELGAVPPFLANKEQPGRLPGDPDVSQGSEDAGKILDWNGDVSILGAQVLIGACTQADGWSCPCLSWNEMLTGPVTGWCN